MFLIFMKKYYLCTKKIMNKKRFLLKFLLFAYRSLTNHQKKLIKDKFYVREKHKKGASYLELMEQYNTSYSSIYKYINDSHLNYR